MSGILKMEGKTPSRVLREEAKKRKERATEQEARQEYQRGNVIYDCLLSYASSVVALARCSSVLAKPSQRISPEV